MRIINMYLKYYFQSIKAFLSRRLTNKFYCFLVFLSLYYIGWSLIWQSPRLFSLYAESWLVRKADRSSLVPNIVYVAWCSEQYFEFKNYLSVKSIFATLRPFHVVLVYERLPRVDFYGYNSWLEELRAEEAWMQVVRSPFSICSSRDRVNVFKMAQLLIMWGGGIYIRNDVVLTPSFASRIINEKDLIAKDSDAEIAAMALSAEYAVKVLRNDPSVIFSNETILCGAFDKTKREVDCVHINRRLNPRDIWTRDDWMGRHLRSVIYGSTEIVEANRDNSNLVPNIAHLTWFGGDQVRCQMYLAVLSLIYLAKVDEVLIHADVEPNGRFWPLIQAEKKVRLIRRSYLGSVFDVRPKRIAHNMDIIRNDIMLRYGGIYIDTDVFFLSPLSTEQRSYDASISYNWATHFFPIYPDHLINGVLVGKPSARFWKTWMSAIRSDFRDYIWSYAGCLLSYKIKERQPRLIRIDPRLQLACFKGSCYPTVGRFGGGVPRLADNATVEQLTAMYNSVHFTYSESRLYPPFIHKLKIHILAAAAKTHDICPDINDI